MKPKIAKNRVGRPSIGRRILVTLTDAQMRTAAELGSGIVSAGVRLAIDEAAGRLQALQRAIDPEAGAPLPDP